MATGTDATREIWRFIFGIDLIERVRYPFMPADTPLVHMILEPEHLRLQLDDSLWLRILDAKTALEARGYAAADRIAVRLHDPGTESNDGTWLLDTTGDNAAFSRTETDAELTLDANDLGAIYLGGNSMSELVAAGRGIEHRPGAGRRMDALFRTQVAPWCPEIF